MAAKTTARPRIRISQLSLDLVYKIPPGAIYARIVEKCGDRKYWPQWATDVAQIADRIRARVTGLIQSPERITLREDFHSFLADLQQTLNPALQEEDLVAMVAQHLVTGPVFQALFADYDFVGSNPVSQRPVSLGGAAGSRRPGERNPGNWKASMTACAAALRPWTTPRPARRCCWSSTNASSR